MSVSTNAFIDIHAHILPGLDDGPADEAGSIAMAHRYREAGIKTVVATPHFLPGTAWAPDAERVRTAVHSLQASLDQKAIDLEVISGMEIAYHRKLVERIDGDQLLPLGESGHYLIEPPFQGGQQMVIGCLRELLSAGRNIILAHPERTETFQHSPEQLLDLVDAGMKIQVNAGSLLGRFGSSSRETAEYLRRENCLHFIASDAHDHGQRAPISPEDWHNLHGCPGGAALLSFCTANCALLFGPVSDNQ